MSLEHRLAEIADNYRITGYQVLVRPGPNDLPPFAKDFHVEIVARREDGNVLASVKRDQAEMQLDTNLPRYAEAIENQPGWRYDLFVLAPERDAAAETPDVQEQSGEALQRSLNEAEKMLASGLGAQAFISAWAALESAMRQRLRAEGSDAGWGTSPRSMLDGLLSSGVISYRSFGELKRLSQLRNILVHGFAPPAIESTAVSFLIDTARRLLEESRVAAQTA